MRSVIKFLFSLVLLLAAAAAGLFWFPTGSWLVLPLARHFGDRMVPSLRIERVEGSLRQGYSVSGAALVSGDDGVYLSLDRLCVSPDWGLILSGTPWLKSLELEGASSDAARLQSLAEHFGGGEGGPAGASLQIRPMRVLVRDVTLSSPQGVLKLDSLTLGDDGHLSLRSRFDDLPVNMEAQMGFSPLGILSSDIGLGAGRGALRGRLEPPFDFRADLTALPLETVLRFVPDKSFRGSGRLDGRLVLKGSDAGDMEASGVLSMTRGVLMDVPMELRLPWSWKGGVLSLAGARVGSLAAEAALDAALDLSGGLDAARLFARGSARNISLKNIGRIAAPGAGLGGEGGLVSFDLSAGRGGSIAGDLTARLPEVVAGGKRVVRSLAVDVRLRPGEAPKLSCTGEVFGGKLFGRGEVAHEGGTVRPQAILSLVNVDLAALAAAFPVLAGAAPSGRVGLRLQIGEDLSVAGKFSSQKLTAGGVTVQDLDSSLSYRNGRAQVQSLTGRIGKAPVSVSGEADAGRGTLDFRAAIQGLDPRSIPRLGSQFQGTLDVSAAVKGTFSDPAVTVRASGRNNRVADIPLTGLDLSASYGGGRLAIPETRLGLPGGAVSLRGAVSLTGEPHLDVEASLPSLDLAALSKALRMKQPVSGTVRGSIRASGPLSSAAISANLRADKVRSGKMEAGRVELVARGNAKRVEIEKVEALVGKAVIRGKGQAAIAAKRPMDSRIDLNLGVKGLELRPFLAGFGVDSPVGGVLDGALALKGTAGRPELTLRVDSPLSVSQTIIDSMSLSIRSPKQDQFDLSAGGKIGRLNVALGGNLRREGGAWRYSVETKPVDIGQLIAVKAPAMQGMAAGTVTVRAGGSTGGGPVSIQVSAPKLTAMDKVAVTDISLPLRYEGNRIRMKEGRATLARGAIRAAVDVDLGASRWSGTLTARGVDMGRLAAPFLPEGELVGSADMDVRMKGNFGVLSMAFASGSLTTGSGYLHKMGMIDRISPTKRISFERIRSTFFWDGSDLFFNPGTQATAGPDEPLYRYFSLNGSAGVSGKGLKLICKGRFDIKMLDRILGALRGVFQYVTGSLTGGGAVLRDAMGRALGVRSRDFQDISFTLANSWQELQLLDLKIDKSIQDILPIDRLNSAEEQKDDKRFRLNLKFPTGPGGGYEEETTEDQLKEQIIDNLFNIGG